LYIKKAGNAEEQKEDEKQEYRVETAAIITSIHQYIKLINDGGVLFAATIGMWRLVDNCDLTVYYTCFRLTLNAKDAGHKAFFTRYVFNCPGSIRIRQN
jgi:hypothetical protein